MDEEESTREIDRWVTNLVDLIPTTIYVSFNKDIKTILFKGLRLDFTEKTTSGVNQIYKYKYLVNINKYKFRSSILHVLYLFQIPTATDKNQTEKLSKVEKRRRRLDPETCLTTSMVRNCQSHVIKNFRKNIFTLVKYFIQFYQSSLKKLLINKCQGLKVLFQKALMTIDDSPETTTDTDRSDLRPSELKERFAAKMAEIRANQKRDLPKTPRTAEEQAVVR